MDNSTITNKQKCYNIVMTELVTLPNYIEEVVRWYGEQCALSGEEIEGVTKEVKEYFGIIRGGADK